jgi:serine/threonine protein kinase
MDCPVEVMEARAALEAQAMDRTQKTISPNVPAKATDEQMRIGMTTGEQAKADALVGTVFADKYEILSVLGRGGMSLVYKARHKFMNRIVAVKVLLEQLVTDEAAVQRFQQESQAASTLNHQNVVTVYDFGQTPNGQAYFVMDCLEGASLSDVIEKDGRVEVKRALNLFEQICDGLDHAHKKGIIHRDLKPNNIVLLEGEGGQESIKIVDFGIAKIISSDGTPQQRLTQTGEIFGSPFYMSPEQCQGFPLDQRSDIYSLGCLMYETLTGYPPQMGESFVATALKHINDPPPSFASMAPGADLPKQIEFVVAKCLEKNPKDRYASAEQVKQALMDAALNAGLPGLRPGAVKMTQANSPMRQTWEKLSGIFVDGAASRKHAPARNIARLMLMLGPLLGFGILFGIVMLYPGPELDRGTPWNKLMWQFAISNANKAAARNDFKDAYEQLKKAEELANTFGDEESRLRATVALESEIYGKANDFDKQHAANVHLNELNEGEVLKEEAKVMRWLNTIDEAAKNGDSFKAAGNMNANAIRVLTPAKRLHARNKFEREEKLLRHAIRVFTHLGLRENEVVAEFKMTLADCLIAQQRFPEVRPLIVDALKVREAVAGIDNYNHLPRGVKRNDPRFVNVAQSMLKLGQFDRDQSAFSDSEKELDRAHQLIDRYLPDQEDLKDECKNSIDDLHRQEDRTQNKPTEHGGHEDPRDANDGRDKSREGRRE